MQPKAEHRVINGLLKAGLGIGTPERAAEILSRDVEIIADPKRTTPSDLWPCVWALANVCTRQFRGTVWVNCGLTEALPSPSRLATRCRFRKSGSDDVLRIGVGVRSQSCDVLGDVRGQTISFGEPIEDTTPANPISGFGLAGYLGFAALATAVGIPPFRVEWAKQRLSFPLNPMVKNERHLAAGLSLIGLGQIGQAYLSLIWFLGLSEIPLSILDKDDFGIENEATQILLDEERALGQSKATFLADKFRAMGFTAHGKRLEVTWDWTRPVTDSPIVLVGVDNFDARRMIACAGYEWMFESGVGTDFTKPRITWHVLPGNRNSGRTFQSSVTEPRESYASPDLRERLKDTPGGCGWLTFQSTTAAAPSMGLVAAARVLSELFAFPRRGHAVTGTSLLWSPLLPASREVLLLDPKGGAPPAMRSKGDQGGSLPLSA